MRRWGNFSSSSAHRMEYELPHMEKHAKLKAVKLRAEEIPKRELHFGDFIWGTTTDDEEQTF